MTVASDGKQLSRWWLFVPKYFLPFAQVFIFTNDYIQQPTGRTHSLTFANLRRTQQQKAISAIFVDDNDNENFRRLKSWRRWRRGNTGRVEIK